MLPVFQREVGFAKKVVCAVRLSEQDSDALLYRSGALLKDPRSGQQLARIPLSPDRVLLVVRADDLPRLESIAGARLLTLGSVRYVDTANITINVVSMMPNCQSFAGFTINCPESGDTVVADLREIVPTYYFAPPRVFENLLTQLMIRMEDAANLLFRSIVFAMCTYGPKHVHMAPVQTTTRRSTFVSNAM